MIEEIFSNVISKYKKYIVLCLISIVLAGLLAMDTANVFYLSIINIFVFAGFLLLNLILFFCFYIYFSSVSADRSELLFLRHLKCWSVFIPVFMLWLVFRVIAPDFCELCWLFWPVTYLVIFAVINHTLTHSKKLYKDKQLFADRAIADKFSDKKVVKINIDGEIRNCIELGPGENIEFNSQDFLKVGYPVSNKLLAANHKISIEFVSAKEKRLIRLEPKDFYNGWHDIVISGSGDLPLQKVTFTNNSRKSGLLSVRSSKICKKQDIKNVIVLIIDGISPDFIGLYSDSNELTPNINSFFSGAGARLFQNAFSQAEWTLPAFASIVTSLYPTQHGMSDPNKYSDVLPADVGTLPELLQRNGFATFGFVSHARCGPRYGHFRGFDEFIYRQIDLRNKFNHRDITNRGLKFLEENPGEKKFVFMHYFNTHTPYFPDVDEVIKFEAGSSQMLRSKVNQVDSSIREIFNFLSRQEMLNQTLIILTSDHGPGKFGDTENQVETDLKESNIRVPFLVFCPDRLNGFEKVESIIEASIDIMPTVCDFLNVPLPEYAQGESVLGQRRKNESLSESVFKTKYELVQRFATFKNYLRLQRDRKRGTFRLERNIAEYIKTYPLADRDEILAAGESRAQLAEWWMAQYGGKIA